MLSNLIEILWNIVELMDVTPHVTNLHSLTVILKVFGEILQTLLNGKQEYIGNYNLRMDMANELLVVGLQHHVH